MTCGMIYGNQSHIYEIPLKVRWDGWYSLISKRCLMKNSFGASMSHYPIIHCQFVFVVAGLHFFFCVLMLDQSFGYRVIVRHSEEWVNLPVSAILSWLFPPIHPLKPVEELLFFFFFFGEIGEEPREDRGRLARDVFLSFFFSLSFFK